MGDAALASLRACIDRCRTGPHCMKMIGWWPSLRATVADSPSTYLAFARLATSSKLGAAMAVGNGFAMTIGVGQTDEQVPPIEHQRDDAGHQAAAFEIAGGEATPTPLVLQLVE